MEGESTPKKKGYFIRANRQVFNYRKVLRERYAYPSHTKDAILRSEYFCV